MTTDVYERLADALDRLPPRVRGRILGLTQSTAFAMQFLSSFVVAWALGASGPAFPNNYALLIGLAGVAVMISWVALLFYREPRGEVDHRSGAELHLLAHARQILTTDRAFRLNAIVRLLIGGIGFAMPFYVVQATQVLQVPTNTVGLFLAAQTVGGVMSSLILGAVSQRRGSPVVIRITILLAQIPPLLALLLYLFAQSNATLATLGTVLIFFAVGATDGSFLLGFLQHEAEGSRQIRQAVTAFNRVTLSAADSEREQAEGGRRVRDTVAHMNRIAFEVRNATREQAQGGRQIVGAVENMNGMTQQVSEAAGEQRQGGELVLRATANIAAVTQENVATVAELARATGNLTAKADNLMRHVKMFRSK